RSPIFSFIYSPWNGRKPLFQFIYITIFRRYVPHAGVVLIDQARHQIPTKHSEEMNLPHLRL
ncbi:hypothetical protein P9762_11540, partial [Geobacillus stearothermophilus]|nr:hypothetical protein [Geobacillus stearothermophilus]